ncbi:MAG: hypothetical protein KGH79_02355 [Patescibacteria group bacterium]|nr:hypothetical protein [Patescibacteria group bacterium]
MNNLLLNLASKAIVSLALVMLVFSPFEPLLAQAQAQQNAFTSGTSPISNIAPSAGTVGAVSNATTPTTFGSVSAPSDSSIIPTNAIMSGQTAVSPSAAAAAAGTPAAAASAPVNQGGTTQAPTSNCAIWGKISGQGIGGDAAQCFTDIIYVFTIGIGSTFAYVAAMFFDFAIQLSLNGSAYALSFVSQGWTTARDIANMAFLFILLYIAFLIMFEAETSGTLHMLAAVIVVALLVNFSFFFTRLVIDAGNILSIQFYNAIQVTPASSQSLGSTSAAGFVNGAAQLVGLNGQPTKDLTASIMGMLQLQGLLGNPSFGAFQQSGNYTFSTVLISLTFLDVAAAIMLWLLTIAFITNGVKFLFRIVVLWFLIIASPLAFIAKAIPNAKINSYFDQWQSLLIQHAFYPAVFMFIFLMLTNFSNQMACTTTGTTSTSCNGLIGDMFAGLSKVQPGGFTAAIGVTIANVAIRLGFVIAILYIGLEASKKIGVMGAHWAESAGSWFGSKYAGLMTGGLGFAGRQTIGRGANALGNSAAFNRTVDAAERTGVNRGLWRGLSRATKNIGSATFDIRNTPGVKQVLKDVGGKAGGEGGFAGQQKAKADALLKEKQERSAIIRDAANKEALGRISKAIESGTAPAQADIDRVRNFGKREMGKISSSDLERMAHLMTETQLKGEMDNENRTDAEKESIRKIADPIIKAQKIVVDDLRKLNDNLTTTSSAVVAGATRRGSNINATSVAAMRADLVNVQMPALRANLAAAVAANNHGQVEDIKSDMTQLRNAVKNLRDLDRHVGRVQPHAGNIAGSYTSY